ncbi:MAG TPA: DUF222 domain-containing protein, partial [Acidimicrobiales bacterium]|nr:DUF222 domain-containing protein [Acidimicrobiales bacterium]
MTVLLQLARMSCEEVGRVSESVVLAARALRDALAGFEPMVLSGRDCAGVVEELAKTEKACGAARARAAVRAAECGAHRELGFADGADWLAARGGSSIGQARAEMDTATAVEDCPDTKAAWLEGQISSGQAGEIVRTEAEVPGSEAELLELAKQCALGALRDQARNKRLAAADPEHLHGRQQAGRRLRHWRDELGMVCLAGALTPEVGVRFVNRLEAETDRLYRQARTHGHSEPRQAYAADALANLVAGAGKAKSSSADLVVVCDLAAYRRGHPHDGETCHLVGGGPIPVWLARQLGADAFLKAVVHDGVRIDTVAHFGRHIPAELRTALELGPPPHFDGVSCVEAGCHRRYHLE